MSRAAFKRLWLDADTFIGPMTPPQVQKLRALCEMFYEAGRRAEASAGYVLVPVEPTVAMLECVAGVPWDILPPGKKAAEVAAYSAMLAAARK